MNLIKRVVFGLLLAIAIYLVCMIVTVPLMYVMNYFVPSPELTNATTGEMIVLASKMSGALLIPPLLFFCHSELPDHLKLETDVVLDTISSLFTDAAFLLLIASFVAIFFFW
ncbi:hypothetical protein HNW13_018475 [Shewanella sp. BF02_Schw]|uniref:hypothetical protein n=1 Tax=Shewanella sp. BF02_Schw TaxID=394908 RepID=UPI001782B484|nr:hypothetical protein [Shewanella sp. BF02_Schw]MBO1897727.1 hypothetical protein [Shewanella sp. BF02_Schw]